MNIWIHYPALYTGLSLLIGAGWGLWGHWILCLPTAGLLFFAGKTWKWVSCGLCLMIGAWGYTQNAYNFPKGVVEGQMWMVTEQVSFTSSPPRWHYRGVLKEVDGKPYGIPISMTIPIKGVRPDGDWSCRVKGQVERSKRGGYYLKVKQGAKWEKGEKVSRFVEWRMRMKQRIQRTIHAVIFPARAADFLAGLVTGEFDNRDLTLTFGRFGMQHLLAISGFHFAILSAFLQRMLRLVFPYKPATFLALTGVTAYCLFLGKYPSVIRSWAAIFLCLFGLFVRRPSVSLNSLGIGLLLLLSVDPLSALNLGFQFSFAVTASILLFYPPSEQWMQKIIPKRSLDTLLSMSLIDQHLVLILPWLRKSIALGISVSLVAFPFTLSLFHSLPLLSFLFNLFIPFLVSLSMLLLFFSWLPPIAKLNGFYTATLLDALDTFPTTYDITVHTTWISTPLLVTYLTLLFLIGLRNRSVKSYFKIAF